MVTVVKLTSPNSADVKHPPSNHRRRLALSARPAVALPPQVHSSLIHPAGALTGRGLCDWCLLRYGSFASFVGRRGFLFAGFFNLNHRILNTGLTPSLEAATSTLSKADFTTFQGLMRLREHCCLRFEIYRARIWGSNRRC
jgi:hypothetical protein